MRALLLTEKFEHVNAEIAVQRDVLVAFGQSIEGEFVALGQALGNMMVQINQIAQEAALLADIIENRDDKQPITSAFQLFKKAIDLVAASLDGSNRIERELRSIYLVFIKIQSIERDFAQSCFKFQLLTTYFSMEIAALPSGHRDDFTNLAADMRVMFDGLKGAVEVQFKKLHTVMRVLSTTNELLTRFHQKHQHELSVSRERIQQGLDHLHIALAPALAFSRSVGEGVGATRAAATRVIVALQYQDIVRQKLEHVGSAFDEMLAQLAPGKVASRRGRVEAWHYIQHTAGIQLAQIQAARTDIENAGGEVMGGLKKLHADGGSILTNAQTLLDSVQSALRENDMVASFGAELLNLNEALADYAQISGQIQKVIISINEFGREFSTCIMQRSYDARLLALNAQLHAVRLGENTAIGELSLQTQQNSDAIISLAGHIVDKTKSILNCMELMKQSFADFITVAEQDERELKMESDQVQKNLREMLQDVLRKFALVSENYGNVQRHTETLLQEITFPQAIGERFAAAERMCQGLVTRAAAQGRQPPQGELLASISSLRANYTMQEERKIHDRALGQTASATVASAAVVTAASVASTDDMLFSSGPAEPAPELLGAPTADPNQTPVAPGDVELF